MIRIGVVADLPEITRIRTAVTENHLSIEQMAEMGITHDSVAAEMQAGDLACWVANENDVITGFSMADRRDGSVFGLFMDPAHEKKGHGSALLATCEDWLRQQGHSRARLTTERSSRAYHFYLRRGWQEESGTAGYSIGDATLVKRL